MWLNVFEEQRTLALGISLNWMGCKLQPQPCTCYYASANSSMWTALCRPVVRLMSIRPSGYCPRINTYFAWCNMSVLSGGISVKLATNVYHVSGICSKGLPGQRSKVKVIARPNAVVQLRDSRQLLAIHLLMHPAEAYDNPVPINSVCIEADSFNVFCLQIINSC